MLVRQVENAIMAQGPRRGEHEVARSVGPGVLGAQVVLGERADGLAGTGDLEPERVPGEQSALGEVVDVDVPAVRVHLVEDLLQDDLALQLEFLE